MTKYRFSNKELLLFFLVTFGLTVLMGIAMGYAYSKGLVEAFVLLQMYYPAIGVMIALFLTKERRQEVPTKFFISFLFFSIISIIYVLYKTFMLNEDPVSNINGIGMIASVSLIIMYFQDYWKKIDCYGLTFTTHIKKSLAMIVLFIFLYFSVFIIDSFFYGYMQSFIRSNISFKAVVYLLMLVISFPFSFIFFLGEEYGWRYFLQPALQERFGKRKGVLLLGFLWGIWHLPVNMYYYNPSQTFYSIVIQIAFCLAIGVFLGYVYMKTTNIWAVTFIHFLNNSLSIYLPEALDSETTLSFLSVLIIILYYFIVYFPFLLTREYRKKDLDDHNHKLVI